MGNQSEFHDFQRALEQMEMGKKVYRDDMPEFSWVQRNNAKNDFLIYWNNELTKFIIDDASKKANDWKELFEKETKTSKKSLAAKAKDEQTKSLIKYGVAILIAKLKAGESLK